MWICPEVDSIPGRIIIFPGEMLQILTRSRIRACVHRVRSLTSIMSIHGSASLTDERLMMNRISAPLLIRGNYSKVFSPRKSCYTHPGGEEAVSHLADLEGVSMKEIHKILDFKRLKCKNEADRSGDKSWVLNAFNIAYSI